MLVTISDRKLQVQSGASGTAIDYYAADIITATDYYPFGMDMVGRKYGLANRYGFNGKERDIDMNSLTAYDYGFRIYNPAIWKFLSVDPLTSSYPWYTPYQFAGNKPIWATDIDGLEENTTSTHVKKPITFLKIPVFKGTINVYDAIHKVCLFNGNYSQWHKKDYNSVRILNAVIGSNIENGLSVDFSVNGQRRELVKGPTISYLYFYEYSYTFNYLNEDNDVVTESGTFDLQYGSNKVSSIFEPIVGILLNKLVSFAFTKIINGVNLLKNITFTARETIGSNGHLSKLLRWAEASVKNINPSSGIINKYEAAAKITKDFTKRLGNKAIEQLKGFGYTKEDFLKWQKIYTDQVKRMEGPIDGRVLIPKARLESVNKILELWK
ncbi:MAG: hypothetical protein NTW29_09045 [Bacteroidetes bacterium]|nr:hypothetical protein [Bacteroidota bacterium]